ncbi:hypothetical protein QN219_22990 [Sinorhizobium sp. 7-81]|uniref:hypothetical protein n=1 Tax=Sinorhizobium sp. 8-89 TaxID=3049089 RepID=UPI0024C42ABA|nr:hypothetical protein [Sinorhizobium sp. 8-89]MDK1492891.1 hypothetical protein [Sinorhizobium sp. 8-89]
MIVLGTIIPIRHGCGIRQAEILSSKRQAHRFISPSNGTSNTFGFQWSLQLQLFVHFSDNRIPDLPESWRYETLTSADGLQPDWNGRPHSED